MVECTGLENRRTARYRGFESLPDRSGGWHHLAWSRTGSHNHQAHQGVVLLLANQCERMRVCAVPLFVPYRDFVCRILCHFQWPAESLRQSLADSASLQSLVYFLAMLRPHELGISWSVRSVDWLASCETIWARALGQPAQ